MTKEELTKKAASVRQHKHWLSEKDTISFGSVRSVFQTGRAHLLHLQTITKGTVLFWRNSFIFPEFPYKITEIIKSGRKCDIRDRHFRF